MEHSQGNTPVLYGVGVGPGDPELLTLKAVRVLSGAARVFLPVADTRPHATGRAEAVLEAAGLLDPARAHRLTFAMTDDFERTAPHWEAAARAIAAALEPGVSATAAFVTLGDPNLYSTFTYVARVLGALRPDVRIETVPGVTAMQAMAAASGRPLVSGDESLALVAAVEGLPGLDSALDRADTVVVYKSGRRLPKVRAAVDAAGRLGEAVLGTQLGMRPEQDLVAGEAIPDRPAEYFSTLIVRRPR